MLGFLQKTHTETQRKYIQSHGWPENSPENLCLYLQSFNQACRNFNEGSGIFLCATRSSLNRGPVDQWVEQTDPDSTLQQTALLYVEGAQIFLSSRLSSPTTTPALKVKESLHTSCMVEQLWILALRYCVSSLQRYNWQHRWEDSCPESGGALWLPRELLQWCPVPVPASLEGILPRVRYHSGLTAGQQWAQGEAASCFTHLVNHHRPTPPSFGRNLGIWDASCPGFPVQEETLPAQCSLSPLQEVMAALGCDLEGTLTPALMHKIYCSPPWLAVLLRELKGLLAIWNILTLHLNLCLLEWLQTFVKPHVALLYVCTSYIKWLDWCIPSVPETLSPSVSQTVLISNQCR